MLKNLITLSLLLTTLQAQCWLPIGPVSTDPAWMACHGIVLHSGPWTHRFDETFLTPQQEALAKAIAMHEQGVNTPADLTPEKANKRGDNGNAVGPFQMWAPAFQDALAYSPEMAPGLDAYPYHLEVHCWDIYQPEPDQWMHTYFWWENNLGAWYSYAMKYGYNDMMHMDAAAAERIARKHNGGPKGDDKDATKKYWKLVKAKILQHYPGIIPGL